MPLALESSGSELTEPEASSRRGPSAATRMLAGLGGGLQAGRHVDRVARDHGLAGLGIVDAKTSPVFTPMRHREARRPGRVLRPG